MSPSSIFTWRVPCYYLCSAAMVICVLWVNLLAYNSVRVTSMNLSIVEWHERDFSYIEDDHPPTFIPPSQHPRNVALITEETVHYFPNASHDWQSMLPTGSEGFVRLGTSKRLFGISMYHQLHCLGRLQQATTVSWDTLRKLQVEHLHHCLNYLRQTLLCAASVRLEALEDDPAGSGGKKTDGIGLEHRCRDWMLVRREVEANFEHWSWEDELP